MRREVFAEERHVGDGDVGVVFCSSYKDASGLEAEGLSRLGGPRRGNDGDHRGASTKDLVPFHAAEGSHTYLCGSGVYRESNLNAGHQGGFWDLKRLVRASNGCSRGGPRCGPSRPRATTRNSSTAVSVATGGPRG